MMNNEINLDKETIKKLEEMAKNITIDSATLEKIGAVLLSFGYGNFFFAGNAEIAEVLKFNNIQATPREIQAFGQIFTVIGYLLLLLAVTKFIQATKLEPSSEIKTRRLPVLQSIQAAYFGSLVVNYIRLVDFNELVRIDREFS